MNGLSWILYLTNVLTKFNDFMTPMLAITAIFVIGPMIFCSVYYETDYDYVNHERVRTKTFPLKHISWHLRWAFPIWAIIFSFVLLIPSKETIYMIATSQVGEQITQLQEVQEIGGEVGGLAKDTIELLRQNIQEQLTEKPVQPD